MSFNYAGQGLAFNPANNSLFLSGYVIDNTVGEITIPSSIVNSTQPEQSGHSLGTAAACAGTEPDPQHFQS